MAQEVGEPHGGTGTLGRPPSPSAGWGRRRGGGNPCQPGKGPGRGSPRQTEPHKHGLGRRGRSAQSNAVLGAKWGAGACKAGDVSGPEEAVRPFLLCPVFPQASAPSLVEKARTLSLQGALGWGECSPIWFRLTLLGATHRGAKLLSIPWTPGPSVGLKAPEGPPHHSQQGFIGKRLWMVDGTVRATLGVAA